MKKLTVSFKHDTIDIVATKDSGIVHHQELWISVTKVCRNNEYSELEKLTLKLGRV